MPGPDEIANYSQPRDPPSNLLESKEDILLNEIADLKRLIKSRGASTGDSDDIDRHQVVVWGRVKPTKAGGDIIVFEVYLFLLKLIFIVNIPDRDDDRAKIYMKFRLNEREQHFEKTQEASERRRQRNERDNDSDMDDDR